MLSPSRILQAATPVAGLPTGPHTCSEILLSSSPPTVLFPRYCRLLHAAGRYATVIPISLICSCLVQSDAENCRDPHSLGYVCLLLFIGCTCLFFQLLLREAQDCRFPDGTPSILVWVLDHGIQWAMEGERKSKNNVKGEYTQHCEGAAMGKLQILVFPLWPLWPLLLDPFCSQFSGQLGVWMGR